MASTYLFRGSLVHHAPVPRKLTDHAVLIWGIVWTVISATTITVCWLLGSAAWDPLWAGATIIGISLTATLTAAVSRLDVTLVFSLTPAALVILYLSSDLGTAVALWGTANLITLAARMRHIGDAAEQLAYVLGSAIAALALVDWLRGTFGWREAYTAVALVVYFAARFTISTIRMSVVTPISLRTSIAAIIPLRAAAIVVGTPVVCLAGRALQIYIDARSPELGHYWGGAITILVIGMLSFVLAMIWTIRAINTQLRGIHDAAIGLPWAGEKPVTGHAEHYAAQALPHCDIEFRREAGRNINEISSPLADGHLIARRGSSQAPLLEADQLVLDSIAHIADTMMTVRRDHDRLFQQTLTDTITKLPNYRAFMEVLDQTAREATSGFAVVYIDLDGFKAVNDRHGHSSGNVILRTLGRRFRDHLTDDEFVARVGGDEFVLVLAGLESEQAGHDRVEQLFSDVCAPVRIGAASVPVVLSYGLSYTLPGGFDPGRLVDEADARMYEGRGVRRSADDSAEPFSVCAVARAIRESALLFAYQPIVDTETGTIISLEALVRPGDSSLAGVSAEDIVERARCEGLLTELSLHLVRTATADMMRFQQIAPTLTGLHINIDVEQVVDDDFMRVLRREWDGSGISLTLELGEASLGRRLDGVTSRLDRMIEIPGLHVALDDFGSDACTLQSIIHYPFDVLKVDRAITMSVGTAKADTIARGIVRFGHSTETRVIVEGVEDQATYDRLREQGVRYMQGYMFGRPMLADDLAERLSSHGLTALISS